MTPSEPVVSVLALRPLEGNEEALVRFFRDSGVFERSRESGGFRSGRLLVPVEPEQPFLVVAEWDDAESYERWLANPVRDELGSGLEPLLAADATRGSLYREVVASKTGPPGRTGGVEP